MPTVNSELTSCFSAFWIRGSTSRTEFTYWRSAPLARRTRRSGQVRCQMPPCGPAGGAQSGRELPLGGRLLWYTDCATSRGLRSFRDDPSAWERTSVKGSTRRREA